MEPHGLRLGRPGRGEAVAVLVGVGQRHAGLAEGLDEHEAASGSEEREGHAEGPQRVLQVAEAVVRRDEVELPAAQPIALRGPPQGVPLRQQVQVEAQDALVEEVRVPRRRRRVRRVVRMHRRHAEGGRPVDPGHLVAEESGEERADAAA